MKLTGFYNSSHKTSGQNMKGGAITDPAAERWVMQAQRQHACPTAGTSRTQRHETLHKVWLENRVENGEVGRKSA